LPLVQQRLHADLEAIPVLGNDQDLEGRRRHRELLRIDAVDRVLALVPDDRARDQIPVPGAHAAGRESETAPLLALEQPDGRGLKLGRALGHPVLEFGVQPLELPVLAIEVSEHAHLGAQQLGYDRHRHIVDRAHFVTAQMVDLGEMDRRDEDHRDLPEARMLADHRGELETVQLRHAHVHQDDCDLVPEQVLERLLAGRGLDQIVAELAQDHLVGEQLRGLVVDQQDIDLVVVARGHACRSG
jgi:hypothetical protein